MKIWKPEVDKTLQEVKDSTAGVWSFTGIGTFIQRVQDDVDGDLVRLFEHLFKTCNHLNGAARYRSTIIVVKVGEYVAISVGTSGELCKKGTKRVVEVCFFVIVEVEVEIGQAGLSGILQLPYMFDDCSTGWLNKFLSGEADR